MDLVPLAGFFAGPGQGHDVLGEAGGDDDQPSQLNAAQCESWEVLRILTVMGRLNLNLDQL